jgi:hypothetical protein
MTQPIVDPIFKATFLGFFMMAQSPAALNLKTISTNLGIPLDQLTAILRELEAEGRLRLNITQAIAHRLDPASTVSTLRQSSETASINTSLLSDADWETEMQAKLDAEAAEAKAAKKEARNAAI